ncbi:MAG: arsenosugar biosynthesis radical SAM protein ArsS [Chromatiaceae bacterium]|nr:arsenosugar biosynthesis radical SAM protein ArsS [Chromatiaceae bacterium]
MLDSKPLLFPTEFPAIERQSLMTLQVNLGYRCNQSCIHCHVDAGPKRPEVMSQETIEAVLAFMRRGGVTTLDLTGGAPELNPGFRHLVREAVTQGILVLDRCNLTILDEPGQESLAEFLAEQHVEIVASLPCYLEENVDGQRGKGVFEASIRGLKRLNALGYGDETAGLRLNLVYNPLGPSLPPPQGTLEADYKRELQARYGIRFDRLLTLTNMPIRRFGSMLQSKGRFREYLGLLKSAHQDRNLQSVMCRSLVSVDWRGYLYDCDFNQMLDLPLNGERRLHIAELAAGDLEGRPIRVGEHCWGCTAGQGSSCGGALA